MTEITISILILLAGGATGLIFFGGLWLTTRKALTSKTPALLFIASFFFRTAVTLVSFYYLSQGKWQNLLLCLAGFLITRTIITRRARLAGINLKTREEIITCE